MYTINDFNMNEEHVELDFDKVVRLAELIDSEWTVANTTHITTQYGNRLVVINPEGQFFYANDIIAEKLENESSYPYKIWITCNVSKAGKEYTTCYIQNERVSIKDYINQRLVILSCKAIDTKYGTKYVIVTDDKKEMITCWKSLCTLFKKHGDEIVKAGGLELYPVEKFSEKYNQSYVGYADKPYIDESKQTKSKKKFVRKNITPDAVSDGDIPF